MKHKRYVFAILVSLLTFLGWPSMTQDTTAGCHDLFINGQLYDGSTQVVRDCVLPNRISSLGGGLEYLKAKVQNKTVVDPGANTVSMFWLSDTAYFYPLQALTGALLASPITLIIIVMAHRRKNKKHVAAIKR